MSRHGDYQTSPDNTDLANDESDSSSSKPNDNASLSNGIQPEILVSSELTDAGISAKVVAGNFTVLETADGLRLPTNPLDTVLVSTTSTSTSPLKSVSVAKSPAQTDALFPPLPVYGAATWIRTVQCNAYRVSSGVLSFLFLMGVVCGSLCGAIKTLYDTIRDGSENVLARRPHRARELEAEKRRKAVDDVKGKPKLVCDMQYYAQRVGLDVEEFEVSTEDGFILVMQHVFDPHDGSVGRKYPVLLVHGLMQSAGAFCSHDENSLAFYLCKSGYDVWLGNNRCYTSPSHMALHPSDPRMWCWSIRQMGLMDLPSFVDHVLSSTGFAKLALVAHSQGTTQSFVALAKNQHPTLGDKISVFCALAPAVYSGALIGRVYFKFMRLIPPWAFRIIFGIHSFIPFMIWMHSLVPGPIYGWLGYRVFSWLFGWNDTRWDKGLRSRGFMFAPVYVSAESMRWWLGRDGFATQKCILATREEVLEEETMEVKGSVKTRQEYDGGEMREMESRASARTTAKNVEDGRVEIEARANVMTEGSVEKGGEKTALMERRASRRSTIEMEGPGPDRGIEENDRRAAATPSPAFSTAATTPDVDEKPRPGLKQRRTACLDTPSDDDLDANDPRLKSWFDTSFPPLALWIAGSDQLVDGMKLLHRFERGREPDVRLVHTKVIEEYEHLDVIWAIDAIDQVGREVKNVIWRSVGQEMRAREKMREVEGCEKLKPFDCL